MRSSLTRTSMLTVLPFAAVMLSQDVKIHTEVEDDATGLRSVEVQADAQRKTLIKENFDKHLLPRAAEPERRVDQHASAATYRISGDIRFTKSASVGDLRVTRRTEFGGWPPINVVYEYSDTITRKDYEGTDKEKAAAPETKYVYSVRMPGTLVDDPTAIKPKDGKIDGQTVTWELTAEEEKVEVSLTSVEPAGAPIVLASAVLLVILLWLVKTIVVWRKNRPKRI